MVLRPVSILDKTDRNLDKSDKKLDENEPEFVFNKSLLKEIFSDKLEPDCIVSIISIAGSYRTGKSSMFNFFLRYLKATPELKNNGNWLDMDRKLNDGFEWANGSKAHTSGILMWPEIFYETNDNGDRIAIILMDTQGINAPDATIMENIGIFAFSTMLSSVQIYNVSQLIQGDNLQSLHLFTEYGKILCSSSKVKPFQHLWFLVRDWRDDVNYPYGDIGGETYLCETLEVKDGQRPELKSVRNNIHNSFDETNCCLMPHPGMTVQKGRFEGNLNDIENDFLNHVKIFVPMILAKNKLIPKRVNGRTVLGMDLFEYCDNFWELFVNNKMPIPETMIEATVRGNCNAAKKQAQAAYTEKLKTFTSGKEPLQIEALNCFHITAKNESLQLFNEETPIGEEAFKEKYRNLLEDFYEQNLECYLLINDGKTRRVEAAQQRKTIIFIGLVVGALGAASLFTIPGAMATAAASLETALAYLLPEMTLSELGLGVGGVITSFGPDLLKLIQNFCFDT